MRFSQSLIFENQRYISQENHYVGILNPIQRYKRIEGVDSYEVRREWSFSSWEAYVRAGVSGATTGALMSVGVIDPRMLGATGSSVQTQTTQTLEYFTRKNDCLTFGDILWNTAWSAGSAAVMAQVTMSVSDVLGAQGGSNNHNQENATDGARTARGNNNRNSNQSTNQNLEIEGTSYNVRDLHRTQPNSVTNEGPSVTNNMEQIQNHGPNSVGRIPVYVDNGGGGQALIVDGHHRFEAFVRLGYQRVPIQYIRANRIASEFGRSLEDLKYHMFK